MVILSTEERFLLSQYRTNFLLFLNGEISVDDFQATFFRLRRSDSCWMSGRMNSELARELSRLFTATDSYSPEPERDIGEISKEELLSEIKRGYDYLISLEK